MTPRRALGPSGCVHYPCGKGRSVSYRSHFLPSFRKLKKMRRKLSKILDSVERRVAGQTISPAAETMLGAVYGKLHALFLPYRTNPRCWPAINVLRRGYLNGSIGISAAVSGQKNWVAGYDCRHELEAGGLATAVKGSTETTGLCLTSKGRAVAAALCQSLVGVRYSGIMAGVLESTEPCRIRGDQRWVSESKLFERQCQGDTSTWQDWTDMLLEPAASGSVDSTADTLGHVFYRHLKPFEELPVVEGIEPNEAACDAYLAAWKSEIARLRKLEPADGEICIPLSASK